MRHVLWACMQQGQLWDVIIWDGFLGRRWRGNEADLVFPCDIDTAGSPGKKSCLVRGIE